MGRARILLIGLAGLLPAVPLWAETLVAARMLRAETVLTAEDIRRGDESIPGALKDPAAAVGRETKVNIYAGQPIYAGDLAAPAIVERNQLVTLNYHHGGLAIATDGRAMDRGAVGDRVRVMNLASRQIVAGQIMVDGSVSVAAD